MKDDHSGIWLVLFLLAFIAAVLYPFWHILWEVYTVGYVSPRPCPCNYGGF
jgi:TRAP-type mannitol/chloroaromatic compound transport system permease small subunit